MHWCQPLGKVGAGSPSRIEPAPWGMYHRSTCIVVQSIMRFYRFMRSCQLNKAWRNIRIVYFMAKYEIVRVNLLGRCSNMSTKLVAASASCMLRNSYSSCHEHYRGSRGFPWVYLSVRFPMTEMWHFHGALFDFCLKPVSQRSCAPRCPKRCNERVLWSAYQCTNTLNGSGQELRAVCHDGKIGLQDTGREGGVIIASGHTCSPCLCFHHRLSPLEYPPRNLIPQWHAVEPVDLFTAVHKYRILSIYWHDLRFMHLENHRLLWLHQQFYGKSTRPR